MGHIEFKDLTGAASGDERGVLSFVAHWISKEGQLQVIERRKMTFFAKPANCRVIDIEVTLEAGQQVTFEDHHDAVIGLRLALPFDDHYGGRVVNAEGDVNEQGVRGKRSPWIDWTAELQGEKVGVAMFDYPGNLNAPTRWHVRAMGLAAANPFVSRDFDKTLPDGGYTMERGAPLRLRYRVVIHPAGADVNAKYQEFARTTIAAAR